MRTRMGAECNVPRRNAYSQLPAGEVELKHVKLLAKACFLVPFHETEICSQRHIASDCCLMFTLIGLLGRQASIRCPAIIGILQPSLTYKIASSRPYY